MKIKEIKLSIHRKYTQNFNSYGFRIGIMMDVGKNDNPMDCYYQGKAFLNERIKEENNAIADLLENFERVKSEGSESVKAKPKGLDSRELVEIPIVKSGIKVDYETERIREQNVQMSKTQKAKEKNLIDVKLKSTSKMAILVELKDGREQWIPKSVIQGSGYSDDYKKNVKTILNVDTWFLEQEKMIKQEIRPDMNQLNQADLWEGNTSCPECGKVIEISLPDDEIKAIETGLSYCSLECREKHVNKVYY